MRPRCCGGAVKRLGSARQIRQKSQLAIGRCDDGVDIVRFPGAIGSTVGCCLILRLGPQGIEIVLAETAALLDPLHGIAKFARLGRIEAEIAFGGRNACAVGRHEVRRCGLGQAAGATRAKNTTLPRTKKRIIYRAH